MKKRTVAAAVSAVMLSSLVAGCTSGSKDTPVSGDGKKGEESKKPITFSWLAYDRPEGKVRQDWEIFKEIEAKTGVKVEFQVVSQEGLKEKKQIMIATNAVTDFIQVDTLEGRQHGPDKVFLNLKDYMDKAPNMKAFFDKYPEAKAVATGADGGIYTVPVIEGDAEGKGFNFIWYTRKDIMDKYGLKAPTSVEEFYQFLKTLKEKQPDTYPLINNAITGDTGLFTTFGRAFTGIHGFYNVDPATDKYAFAPYHKGYKDSLIFLNKLYNEKLLDPEFSMITQAQWEERILKGKSLVTFFWKADLETLMDKGRKAGIADYTLDAIPQFAADGIKNYQFSRSVVGATGRAISAKVKDKDRAVQFLDYLLSEEGSNYLSLGIEGKTYTKQNGVPVYNKDFGASPFTTLRKDWGVWYDMITLDNAKSRAVWESGLSDKSKAINKLYESVIIPAPKQIVKTSEELELEKSKLNNLNKYLEQKLTEFVSGKTPINDKTWQEFIDQTKKLGADDLLNMYNAAYTRTYGKK
ncbi:extracellular solute-binding protein [Paenibacillus sp. CGMCC 1.16610]|uniref:Extracellular solute-binding protein n=2 Tax=Paenibacillus TaxID=44249 RepID=A0ABU6DAR9_9BACL|nr:MULTISPECIES: extracellular solute-binding protein [Paenibacillus]MBA2941407.1 extracellular solute-binding protein [Paenibacillus sp. CGMCC 1.16610]MCY9659839.1 extracellular solute-binding protein [Paenibacillus anseongense]MEB4793982.1 extracellular solute-binding protein [Paenibacillus chondroitinus]MVQ40226.1 extracellular solute-binding protein [Paenibacillus anseongense]